MTYVLTISIHTSFFTLDYVGILAVNERVIYTCGILMEYSTSINCNLEYSIILCYNKMTARYF